jgi:hypothetical protein
MASGRKKKARPGYKWAKRRKTETKKKKKKTRRTFLLDSLEVMQEARDFRFLVFRDRRRSIEPIDLDGVGIRDLSVLDLLRHLGWPNSKKRASKDRSDGASGQRDGRCLALNKERNFVNILRGGQHEVLNERQSFVEEFGVYFLGEGTEENFHSQHDGFVSFWVATSRGNDGKGTL